ncbi:hypothetical protein BDW22DRAFT_1480515 [Trametopsis cervina]|nr:hypothetical protein BDW22DRAFT_1480515 [Trametopsis cervina]
MADKSQPSSYSCKCLNVRITSAVSPPTNNSPEEVAPKGFILVFAGDDGIDIAHTQLTLRNRGPQIQQTGTTNGQSYRIISLNCLICNMEVYRVSQPALPDVDVSEGPILPTDEWAESDILLSTNGWIQVSSNCLDGKAIDEAQNSTLYSAPFRIIMPPSSPIEQAETRLPNVTPSAASPQIPSSPRSILPHIPALFPPPPFAPSHPVYVHLSGLATAQSEKLRTEAENQLRKILDEKVTELKATEATLKQDVENLWSIFKQAVEKIGESSPIVKPIRRRSSARNGETGVNGVSTSVRVRDFVPAATPPPRAAVASSAPPVSALSASLATSSLHNAMASTKPNGLNDGGHIRSLSETRASAARSGSPSTASSRTLGLPINGEAEIREAYRRNMDQSLDIATSFKYMMDIGAHVQAREPDVPETVTEEADSTGTSSPQSNVPPRGRSPRAGKSAIKKPKTEVDPAATAEQSTTQQEGGAQTGPETTTPKGKRKVTFDVKPDVAFIALDTPKAAKNGAKIEEAVFDMENENSEDRVEVPVEPSPLLSQPEIPVSEPPQAPQAPRRNSRRTASWSGLPSSFSSLRPASLPLPSAVRPPRPPALEPVDERPRSQNIRESLMSPTVDGEVKRRDIEVPQSQEEEEQVTDPREAEILRLVAASTPSHRSAWKKDSSSWKTFVARQKGQTHGRSLSIPEEDESSATDGPAYYDESDDESAQDDEQRGSWSNDGSIARSLPIPIGPLGSGRNPNANETKTNLSASESAALRRASYAARDQRRSLDPGALDFTVEEDDDDEEDQVTHPEEEGLPKSMQRAFKILQKGSETPAAGMWRSLA